MIKYCLRKEDWSLVRKDLNSLYVGLVRRAPNVFLPWTRKDSVLREVFVVRTSGGRRFGDGGAYNECNKIQCKITTHGYVIGHNSIDTKEYYECIDEDYILPMLLQSSTHDTY